MRVDYGHGDRIAHLVDTLTERAASRASTSNLSVTLFGSAIENPDEANDIDLWVDGDAETVDAFCTNAKELARLAAIPVDLTVPGGLPSTFALACAWEASAGRVLVGEMPARPPIDSQQVAEIYREAFLIRAERSLRRADLLARQRLTSAAGYAEAAARLLLRSKLTSGNQWRVARHLTPDEVLNALRVEAPELLGVIASDGWAGMAGVRGLVTLWETFVVQAGGYTWGSVLDTSVRFLSTAGRSR